MKSKIVNGQKLIDEIYARLRKNGDPDDALFDSGLYEATHIIRQYAEMEVKYCPRCAKIAEMFRDET